MKREILYLSIAGVIGAIIFGLIGFIYFVGYGGNNCDRQNMACDCFFCHMFNSRGYESCGTFGLVLGLVIGAVLGVVIIRFFINHIRSNK
jgi:hypothetical protein